MKIRDGFILKKIAGTFVAVPVRQNAVDMNAIIKLSESGAMLWSALEKGADRDDLIAALTAEYEVDEERAAEDIDRFIVRLQDAGVLE